MVKKKTNNGASGPPKENAGQHRGLGRGEESRARARGNDGQADAAAPQAPRGRQPQRRNVARNRRDEDRKKEQTLLEKTALRTINKKVNSDRTISVDALYALNSVMSDFLREVLRLVLLLAKHRAKSKKDCYVCGVEDSEKAIRMTVQSTMANYLIEEGEDAVRKAIEIREERRAQEDELRQQGVDEEDILQLVAQEYDRFTPQVESGEEPISVSSEGSPPPSDSSSSEELLPLRSYRPRGRPADPLAAGPRTESAETASHAAPVLADIPLNLPPDQLPLLYNPKKKNLAARQAEKIKRPQAQPAVDDDGGQRPMSVDGKSVADSNSNKRAESSSEKAADIPGAPTKKPRVVPSSRGNGNASRTSPERHRTSKESDDARRKSQGSEHRRKSGDSMQHSSHDSVPGSSTDRR